MKFIIAALLIRGKFVKFKLLIGFLGFFLNFFTNYNFKTLTFITKIIIMRISYVNCTDG